MTLYDFLLALGFWQWCGVLALAAIFAAAFTDALRYVVSALRRKP